MERPCHSDGRVARIILIATVLLEQEACVHPSVVKGQTVYITFTWPKVILDSKKLMGAIRSFGQDMDFSHGTLIANDLMDFLESFQPRKDDEISSTCDISLPFPVKPDFMEDVLSFENSDARLYLIRMSALGRNLVTEPRGFRVLAIRTTEGPKSGSP